MFMDAVEILTGTQARQSPVFSWKWQDCVGRCNAERADLQHSMQVDELIYFNSLLKTEEIKMLVK